MNVKNQPKYIKFRSFNIPFPPELTVEEILSNRSDDRLNSRAPNRYLILPTRFPQRTRKRTDDIVSMTKISSQIMFDVV
ncbi:unnamed protein product [Rhizophagus irregularis]|nr:unnamed protein product [Rhizophagus irregularis]